MKVIDIRNLELSNGDSEFVDLGKDEYNNTICEIVALELVSGSLTFKGKVVDDEGAGDCDVCALKLADLSKVSSIAAAGAYVIPVEAFSSITFTATADTVATVKVLA